MKKLFSVIMVLMIAMSSLAGCAAAENTPDAPAGTTATVATTQTTEVVKETEPETLPAIPDVTENTEVDPYDIFTYPGAKEATINSNRGAALYLRDAGFTEIWLNLYTDPESLRVGTMGDAIIGQFKFKEEESIVNFRAEKADKIENRTGWEPAADADIQSFSNRWDFPDGEIMIMDWIVEPERYLPNYRFNNIEIYYYPETGNMYSFMRDYLVSDDPDGLTVTDPSSLLCDINSEVIKERVFSIRPENVGVDWNNVCIDTFSVKLPNNETVSYKYRYGASLDEWMHSEYNTDGWHRLPYYELWNEGSDYAVSPKFGYNSCIAGNIHYYAYNDFIINEMLTRDNSKYKHEFDEVKDIYYNPDEFEIGSFYVANNSQLHIYGFNMFNTYNQSLYEGGRGPIYRYSGWYVNYSADSTLTIDGIGLREEDGEHMKFLLVPHYVPAPDTKEVENADGKLEVIELTEQEKAELELTYEKANGYPYANDINAIREAATELTAEFQPASELPLFWGEYIDSILPDYGFRLVLDPQKIDGFKTGVAYDICITYDDEVVYWLFMPEFTN